MQFRSYPWICGRENSCQDLISPRIHSAYCLVVWSELVERRYDPSLDHAIPWTPLTCPLIATSWAQMSSEPSRSQSLQLPVRPRLTTASALGDQSPIQK